MRLCYVDRLVPGGVNFIYFDFLSSIQISVFFFFYHETRDLTDLLFYDLTITLLSLNLAVATFYLERFYKPNLIFYALIFIHRVEKNPTYMYIVWMNERVKF